MRTLIQIDLQNIFYGAKSLDKKIDFEKIWKSFKERDTEFLLEALVYNVQSPIVNTDKFESMLEAVGYKLKPKQAIKLVSRSKKNVYKGADHGISIALDCLDRLESFDKWILISGAGRFSDICKYLKGKGKKIEIWCFEQSFSPSLGMYTDNINFITEDWILKGKSDLSFFGFDLKVE